MTDSGVRLHWQARKDSGCNLEAYLERTKYGYLHGGVEGKATQVFGSTFLFACLKVDLGFFRAELVGDRIFGAVLRHQLQGVILRDSEHEKWMQSRTVFQARFHYEESINSVSGKRLTFSSSIYFLHLELQFRTRLN